LIDVNNPIRRKTPTDWGISIVFIAIALGGCSNALSEQSGGSISSTTAATGGALASLRPKASPELVAKIVAQEQALAGGQSAIGQTKSPFTGLNGLGTRTLPKVSIDPIAPPAEEVEPAGAMVSPVGPNQDSVAAANDMTAQNSTLAVSYQSNYNAVPAPPPGGLSGTLIPPPPAVTLSTQAQAVSPSSDPNNPYLNPYAFFQYMNANGMAFPGQQQPAPEARPSGLFGNGGKSSARDSDDSRSSGKSKGENFVPITPTGMEPRSAYKQRDDLKILWKGLLSSNNVSAIDPKTITQLSKLAVGLPSETTRGNFSITQRQVNAIFKPDIAGVDRRAMPEIHKRQADLVQAYSRYLYTYNKFALAQQSVSARKQEVEVADSASEKQRAAADLAQAQTELDNAKDDMHSAQIELAQTSSPSAARAVVSKVSGVAPGLESLVAADQDSQSNSHKTMIGGLVGSFESVFPFKHGKSQTKATNKQSDSEDNSEVAAQDVSAKDAAVKKGAKAKKSDEKVKVADDNTKKKNHKNSELAKKQLTSDKAVSEAEKEQDLSPAPSDKELASAAPADPTPFPKNAATSSSSPVSFTLKGVNVSARKSILTVAIKNTGSDAFNFSPDVISVSDGNHKLPDAAMRADFDSTFIQPDQEVKGTITIFGRPWSDRLAVALSDGGHSIQLRR
jgi:hypothetical protein